MDKEKKIVHCKICAKPNRKMLIIFGATGDFFAHVGSSLHTTLFVGALTSALSTKQRPWDSQSVDVLKTSLGALRKFR